ncbi:hypothetical protein V8J88_16950 [Massilia sp. W12]|uniref:hypothetical protein n=1 Tax=Massilia sp. W12 TaxID=3126507 RepID=UPI0030D46F05
MKVSILVSSLMLFICSACAQVSPPAQAPAAAPAAASAAAPSAPPSQPSDEALVKQVAQVKERMQACPSPRSKSTICTADYKPVCAVRDTGVRCVRPPCPSENLQTFSNACKACIDSKVSGYIQGECSGPGKLESK